MNYFNKVNKIYIIINKKTPLKCLFSSNFISNLAIELLKTKMID